MRLPRGRPPLQLSKMRALEASVAEKERELGMLQTKVPTELEMAGSKRAFRERLDHFDVLLQSNVPLARQALRKLLDGRIHFIPTQYKREHGYRRLEPAA